MRIAAASTDPSAAHRGRVLADVGDKATPRQPSLCHSERLKRLSWRCQVFDRVFATAGAGRRLRNSAASGRWTATGAPCNVRSADSQFNCRKKRLRIAAIRARARLPSMPLRLLKICTAPRDRIKRGPNLIQDIDSTT
jgi:hypothetical protein